MDPQKIRIACMFLVWTNQWHIYLKGEKREKRDLGEVIINLVLTH